MIKKTLLLILIPFLLYAQDSTIVEFFNNNYIQFGNTFNQDPVIVEDNGRILSRTLEIPAYANPAKLILYVDLIGNGEWIDRAGNIMLHLEDGTDLELMKYVTTYGCDSHFSQDISHLASRLNGLVTIKAFVDTWVSPAWKVNVRLVIKNDATASNADWAEGVYYNTGLKREAVTDKGPAVVVNIPAGMDLVKMNYFTSGHCTDGIGADEFVSKDNVIYVDGVEVHRYEPWRDDCADFTPTNTSGCPGNYHYSRSGWCPGDIVHPVELDLSAYLTPGEHTVRFAVENIRPQDASGVGYWRVSSYTSQWLNGNTPTASKINLSVLDEQFFPTDTETPLRVDLEDNGGLLVIGATASVQLACTDTSIKFTTNKTDYSNPLTVDMTRGSQLVWMKTSNQSVYSITATDVASSLTEATPIDVTILKNYSRVSTATADGACATNEEAEHAIDGRLDTKWCNNSGQVPYHHIIKLPQRQALDYFVVKHAGAGGESTTMNTADYDIEVSTSAGVWTNIAELRDNYEDDRGNVTSHEFATPVEADSVRLVIIDPGSDNATRIYEFEIYNRDGMLTEVENNTPIVPEDFVVYNNYPNPFNGETTVKFFIPAQAKVSVAVYNILGEMVNSILSGTLQKGNHTTKWDAKDFTGNKVAGGIYFYNIKVNEAGGKNYNMTKKIVYLP